MLDMVIISNRDEKMIVWCFMEELCDKYMFASENNHSTHFNIKDFCNMGIFRNYLVRREVQGTNGSSGAELVSEILRKYEAMKGFITIDGDILTLTQKGLAERLEAHRDWDGE